MSLGRAQSILLAGFRKDTANPAPWEQTQATPPVPLQAQPSLHEVKSEISALGVQIRLCCF